MTDKKQFDSKIEDFVKTVNRISSLLKDNKFQMEFRPNSITLGTDISMDEEIKNIGIDDKKFNEIMKEISSLSILILFKNDDKKKKYIRENKSVEEKIKIINERLLTEDMKKEFIFNKTSKNYIFNDIDYEISKKIISKDEKIEPFNIITIVFHNIDVITQSDREKKISFNISEKKLDYLINELSVIKEKLKKSD
ncbi:MAG: hypothetical protein KJ906_04435 [Nanoarchaeota archaeon]|nr:hypothetical protein [Nanoarchaeota archaeon]